jgi:hypothetical protein
MIPYSVDKLVYQQTTCNDYLKQYTEVSHSEPASSASPCQRASRGILSPRDSLPPPPENLNQNIR